MKILNFGSLNIDNVYAVPHFVAPGETLGATRVSRNVGGKGLNQSVALARAGAKVYHAGCVGEDGEFLLSFLAGNGVDISFVKKIEGPSGHAIIQVDENGQNSIILYGGANQCVCEADIDRVLSDFSAGDMLLLQNEISGIPHLIRTAHEKGIAVILNPSPISPELLSAPFELVDWFILNEIEGAALAGTEELADIPAALTAKYPAAKFVMTLGAAGASAFGADIPYVRVPATPVKPVDTTAAGDTFTGYFFASYAEGKTVEEALTLASRAAGIAVTRPGAAASIPLKNEI